MKTVFNTGLVLAVVILATAFYGQVRASYDDVVDTRSKWDKYVTILTDPETRCEYVFASIGEYKGGSGGLSPRLDGDGNQMGCH